MSITMSDLNNRVTTLEGKSSTTPITMSDLKNRIEALEARPVKDFAFETLSGSNGSWSYPSKYQSYDFVLVSIGEIRIYSSRVMISCGQKNLSITSRGAMSQTNVSFSKNSSSIVATLSNNYQVGYPSNITVLFYKQ